MPNADVTINATFKKVSSSTITSDNDSQKVKNDEPKDNKDNGKATENKEKDDTMSITPFGQYGGKMVTISIIGIITMVGVIMYKKSKNIIIK